MPSPAFVVSGGRPLTGTVRPAGNKNAVLPILAATILADGLCAIDNVPRIRDVETMLALLEHLGAGVQWTGINTVTIDPRNVEPRESRSRAFPRGSGRPSSWPDRCWRALDG